MCSRKCFRMPTLVICGVVLTIILVCITGITLTNSINISNIVKLREKVASDSAAANGGHQAAQTRAALVEQQYSTLQQHHLSRSDLNYIQAATHPKNLQRQLQQQQLQLQQQQQQQQKPNKIVIEIGLTNDSGPSSVPASSTSSSSAGPRILQAAEALMEGNVDSISLPAAAPLTAATKNPAKNPESTINNPTNTTPDITMGIADHNPGGIQFERRAHVKQVSCKWMI
ncbi:mediator of RNA polymerase II transcription subunit 15a-like [Drosophila rhopaloa]|uniref:Mediator of RNA polymerase II transcription subunit 15a-like n=1 Tax=Drosophila rhopaloa TaxID=1041015 RepID=A0A6P4FNE4_DRORH|nr:mediator of RNA polymerase II transcription subunit 15a-like [Drosophila rhopaloa]